MNIFKRLYLAIGLALVLCSVLFSCTNRPKGVLSAGKMEDVLVDYHLFKTMVNSLPPADRHKAILYENYFYEQHHITKAQWDSSLVWYSSHTEDFTKIYAKVTDRLRDKRKSYSEQEPSVALNKHYTANGDTASVMNMPSYYFLSQSPVSSHVSFTITPNNVIPRDLILLTIRCSLLAGNSVRGTVMLAVTYANDSTITNYRSITSSGMYRIKVENNNPVAIRSIKGFIYCGGSMLNKSMIIVDEMSLLRVHVHAPMPSNHPIPVPTQPMKLDTGKKGNVSSPPITPNNNHSVPIVSGNNKSIGNVNAQEAEHAQQVLHQEPMDASHPRPISSNRDEIMKKLTERTKQLKGNK